MKLLLAIPGIIITTFLSSFFHGSIVDFFQGAVRDYGYIMVFLAITLESMGVPFPGETMLLIASAYAAQTPQLSIYLVIAFAAIGAVVGDNLGYWIGREG